MKTVIKSVLYLQMTAMLVTAALAGPAAKNEMPFRGTIQTVDTGMMFEFPFLDASAIGTGNATHLGRYTMSYELRINVTESSSTGTYVFTAANGDTLFTTFEGRGFPTDDPIDVLLVLEVHTITGGTGRFAGANPLLLAPRWLARGCRDAETAGSRSTPSCCDRGLGSSIQQHHD